MKRFKDLKEDDCIISISEDQELSVHKITNICNTDTHIKIFFGGIVIEMSNSYATNSMFRKHNMIAQKINTHFSDISIAKQQILDDRLVYLDGFYSRIEILDML